MEYLFFASVGMVFHAYFGYPMTLWVLGLFRARAVKRSDNFPFVTFIVTVFNEEKRINDKILNTIALEYPKDRLQIIIASDGFE
jgi:cellulose synthase/poly-beta-1,6-N-acetylglucosamine synthase-like glycosyltransferase